MADPRNRDPLTDPARLAALRAARLMDTPVEEEYDRLTARAAKLLQVPVAMVSLVDSDRQFFKSAVGINQPWADARQTALDLSVCQHVVRAGESVSVPDTRQHQLTRGLLKLPDSEVVAYLGAPLTTDRGETLGSLCVIDKRPRNWSPQEIELLEELAASTMAIVQQRMAGHDRHRSSRDREQDAATMDGPGPDGAPAQRASGDVLEIADHLWIAAEELLDAHQEYDAYLLESRASRQPGDVSRQVFDRVTYAESGMRMATEEFQREATDRLSMLPDPLETAGRALWLSALYYIEREGSRQDVSRRFRHRDAQEADVAREALLVQVALRELESAAVAYRQARMRREGGA